jgi:PAS domain S-box-containing protein
MALSTTFQRRISLPILELAKVATAVSERQDYSVRATKHGADEIGQLTNSFNQMLTRIGESNAALMASEERLRLALEGSQTGTWDWNLLTGQTTWDDFMFPLFGRQPGDFDGSLQSVLQSIHPDDRARVEQAMREALEQRRNLDIGFRVAEADGSIRHMASRGRAYYDSEGQPVRMSGVSMDVTASKRNEEDLQKAKEEAEAANQAKDHFLAILSHELRTPLTPVLAAVAMLEEDCTLPPHLLDELQIIHRNIEVEAHLIDDLLDVTGIARGKLELLRQEVDIRSLLEHTLQNYSAVEAAKKNLRVSMNVDASDTCVVADSSRITQVFWNLFQNACKFTPEGGTIDIRVYNQPPSAAHNGTSAPETKFSQAELVVEITDNGIGISPENIARIFNAFEQGERSRTRTFGGLGLGLAISRAIVERHGGSLTATSDGKDKGAKLILRLPTVKPSTTPGASKPQGVARTTTSRSLRVLLVEDHSDTAHQLTRLLQRAGHEVVWAASIREAQDCAAARANDNYPFGFDILISDLGLPDGSGHDLMRDFACRHPVPGIALSGYGMSDDIQNSLAAGFSKHMTKPVDWHELKTAIEKLAGEEALQPIS